MRNTTCSCCSQLVRLTAQELMIEQAAPPRRQPNQRSASDSLAPTAHPGHALASSTASLPQRACAVLSCRHSATIPPRGPALIAPLPPPASASYSLRSSPTGSPVATLSSLCLTPLTGPQSVGKSDC